MVLRGSSVLGPHQRHNRKIHTGAAILPLIASALQKIVSDTPGVVMLDDMLCNRVSQSIAGARPQEGIGTIVPHASDDISRDGSAFHLLHVLAQIGNRTYSLRHKHDPVSVSPLG